MFDLGPEVPTPTGLTLSGHPPTRILRESQERLAFTMGPDFALTVIRRWNRAQIFAVRAARQSDPISAQRKGSQAETVC